MVQISTLLLAVFVCSATAFPQGKWGAKGGGSKGGGSIVSPYQKDNSGGSGPYKATYKADPGLPKHTIYYPKTPPNFAMPIIVWGEGSQLLLDARELTVHQVHAPRRELLLSIF
jgi:hypothetical protein